MNEHQTRSTRPVSDDARATLERVQRLRDAVRRAYSAAAERPADRHPFPVGRSFAEGLGYPGDLLAVVPSVSLDAFSGVSSVSVVANVPVGASVLDVGCGAGLDSLIAAGRVGPRGRVLGIDFSAAMLSRACQAVVEAGIGNVAFCQADAENLPVRDDSIDVALVNGIFNLNPNRREIFRELARVVRSHGAVYAAELILREPFPPGTHASEADWFA